MTNLDGHTRRDPVAEELAAIQQRLDLWTITVGDVRNLVAFARDVLARCDEADRRQAEALPPSMRKAAVGPIPSPEIRDTAARHLGGQHG